MGEPAEDPPSEASAEEVDGRFVSGTVTVQCYECLDPVEGELLNRAGKKQIDVELGVRCPGCSDRVGHDVIVPIVVLAGAETRLVTDVLDEEPAGDQDGAQRNPP